MKLVYIVVDGMAGLPVKDLGGKTPLEAAETPNMDYLAETGMTGLMYTVKRGVAPESDSAVISLLGYDPFENEVSRGVLEALGAGIKMEEGDLALRCNFATAGHGNRLVDRRVGRTLTSQEASELAEAINQGVKLDSHSVSFCFKSTEGHRGALVIRSDEHDLTGKISNTDPAYTKVEGIDVAKEDFEMILTECEPQESTERASISADLINEFSKKARSVLEGHEINRERQERGKLKANIILVRGAGHHLPSLTPLKQQFGFNFACLLDMPVERGICKLAGMRAVDLPPPSNSLGKDYRVRVQTLLKELPLHDCFYIHIKGPDEPGHDGDAESKTKLIAAIDEHFIGDLLKKIDLEDYVICVTADHSTPCILKAHSDDPVPLLVSGNNIQGDEVVKFSEKDCKKGGIGVLTRGTELLPMLMRIL